MSPLKGMPARASDARLTAVGGNLRDEREKRLVAGGRTRALGTPSPRTLPKAANQRQSLNFISDALLHGRRFQHKSLNGLVPADCKPCRAGAYGERTLLMNEAVLGAGSVHGMRSR